MRVFCPKCGRLAEYDPYYGRTYCTSCSWRSERVPEVTKKASIGIRATCLNGSLTREKLRCN